MSSSNLYPNNSNMFPKIILHRGLKNQDDNLDILTMLYEELQVAAVEASDPTVDFLSFVAKCFYFAVIYKAAPEVVADVEPKTKYEPQPDYETQNDSIWGRSWTAESKSKTQEFSSSSSSSVHHSNLTENMYDDILGPTPSSGGRFTSDAQNAHNYYDFPTPWGNPPTAAPQRTFPNLTLPSTNYDEPIGMIYLIESQPPPMPGTIGELSIGLILSERYRKFGYGRAAVDKVVRYAFDTIGAHRVQALLTNTYYKDSAINLFTQLHFGHEGTRRRSHFSYVEQEYKDTTCLAIIDTDWVMKNFTRPAPNSLWDEMFLRHERERDELLRWEERKSGLYRTSSTETIRDAAGVCTEVETSSSKSDVEVSESESENENGKGKGKKRQFNHSAGSQLGEGRYASDADDSDVDEDGYNAPQFKYRRLGSEGPSTQAIRRAGSVASSEDGYTSAATSVPSTSSEWDVVDEWSDFSVDDRDNDEM
ncbi:hypothetical protein VNI00_011553 [Paramarasmius palmivorus]|uniref:N-acetyltransferase domain-containing protein n=1 Tax=Paramarasmius palmivorus TaxID=297713 RepID=A0AAW0CCY3_9AGAR